MPRQAATLVEYLKLEDLTRPEREELVRSVRQHDAEMGELERHMDERMDKIRALMKGGKTEAEAEGAVEREYRLWLEEGEVALSMTGEEAESMLALAEEEGRLRIEWKRGWLYFFLDPTPKAEARAAARAFHLPYEVGDGFMECIGRMPRKGGPHSSKVAKQAVQPTRR